MPKNLILTSILLFSIALSSSSCVQQGQSEPTTPNQGAIAQNTAETPALNIAQNPETKNIPIQQYRIMNTYPHDNQAFTQGLLYHQGFLYEGTGLRGQSSLRKVDLETGKVLQLYNLPDRYFGEGIVIWQDKIIQLTWKAKKGFVYNLADFTKVKEFFYGESEEGWGLAHDDRRLIKTDGTERVWFLDKENQNEQGFIEVYTHDRVIDKLNEIEYINGKIYSNKWQQNSIVIINPKNGAVEGIADLRGLQTKAGQKGSDNVLNGIAYDAENDRLFVTGKKWNKLFEIKLIKRQ